MRSAKLPYLDLPPEAREAIDAYFTDWKPRGHFGFARIPLRQLVREVMTKNSDIRFGYKGDFEAYHHWYINQAKRQEGWPPKWAKKDPDSLWAIMLEAPPGSPDQGPFVIWDGWHRFHYYVDHYGPDKLIPVVWFME